MTEPPQSPPTFGLGALFELIAGVALFLALVTQLDWGMGEQPKPGDATFGLGALFEFFAAVALFLALMTQLEWEAAAFLAVIGLLIVLSAHARLFPIDRGGIDLRGCLSGSLIVLLLGLIFMPQFPRAGESAFRAACASNLRQIALALDLYRELHGHYPPAYVADDDGKPMHSWRVLILPFLERKDVYDAYDFDEPWDGPNNRKFAEAGSPMFRCPSDGQLPPGMTSYFYVTGAGRTKAGQAKLTPQDITDGPENTIALVESSTARVNWMDPRDLTVEDALSGENTREAPCPCSTHGRIDHGVRRSESAGFNVAMFDGGVHRLRSTPDRSTLQSLLTIDGGEKIDVEQVKASLPDGDDSHLWVGVPILVGAELVLVIFAVVRRIRLARRLRHSAQLR